MFSNPTYLIAIGAMLSVIIAACGLFMNARATKRQYLLDSYKFVLDQFDYLNSIGAREELRKVHDKGILEYIGDDLQKEQIFKQYIYVCNRLASGMKCKAIDKAVVFSLYNHQWFQEQYQNLKPIIEKEELRRKRPMYIHFKEIGEQS